MNFSKPTYLIMWNFGSQCVYKVSHLCEFHSIRLFCRYTVSASVRRTSMRDKKAMSWKEAREEAQRLRDKSPQNEDDEDDAAVSQPNRTHLPVPPVSTSSHSGVRNEYRFP